MDRGTDASRCELSSKWLIPRQLDSRGALAIVVEDGDLQPLQLSRVEAYAAEVFLEFIQPAAQEPTLWRGDGLQALELEPGDYGTGDEAAGEFNNWVLSAAPPEPVDPRPVKPCSCWRARTP